MYITEIIIPLITLLGTFYIFSFGVRYWGGSAQLQSVCFIILALYLGGLTQLLFQVDILLKLAGGAGVALFVFNQRKLRSLNAHPSLIYFSVMTVSLFFLTSTNFYSVYYVVDDYSHWGAISRILIEKHRFVQAIDEVYMASYPPALALFQYYFLGLSGFSVSGTLFAQGILIIVLLSTLFPLTWKNSRSKTIQDIFLIILASQSIVWIFHEGLHTLWADLPLGLFFGVAILTCLRSKNENRLSFLSYGLPLVILPIIKQIGLVFFLMASVVIFIDIFLKRHESRSPQLRWSLIWVPLGLILYALWDHYIDQNLLGKAFSANFGLADFWSGLWSQTATSYQLLVRDSFIQRVFLSTNTFTYWLLFIILGSIGVWAVSEQTTKWRSTIPLLFLVSGFIPYLLLLLFLYMFSFSPYEGPRLASIERYITTYSTGVIIIILALIFDRRNIYINRPEFQIGTSFTNTDRAIKNPQRSASIWFITIMLLVITPNIGRAISDAYKSIRGFSPKGREFHIAQVAAYIKNNTPLNSKLFTLWDGATSDHLNIMHFMLPGQTINRCFWITFDAELVTQDTPHLCVTSTDELKADLLMYDYLFIGQISQNSAISKLNNFEFKTLKEFSLYKISISSGKVKLLLLNIF